jgi:hypothetical protein
MGELQYGQIAVMASPFGSGGVWKLHSIRHGLASFFITCSS